MKSHIIVTYIFFLMIANPLNATSQNLTNQDVQRLNQVMRIVQEAYVDEAKKKDLINHALQGVLAGLDPHSSYLNEKDLAELRMSTKGEFSGVGIEVTLRNGALLVVSPIDDTPAFEAGIKAGDYIVKVDSQSIRGMKLSEIVGKIRGKRGTKVKLSVVRKGESKPFKITVIRDTIMLISVKSKLLDKYFGYIRISSFQEKTAQSVIENIEKLKKDSAGKLYGVILDLRNNPGGLLNASVDVADIFLDEETIMLDKKIVYTKGKLKSMHYTGKADSKDEVQGVPIVVLINNGSASASEIVAGALQDHKRAVIVGTRSFGKGSVQTIIPISGGKAALKLTTAKYFTPKGQSIQAKGIRPDIVVADIKISDKTVVLHDDYVREANLNGRLDNDESAKEKEVDADYIKSLKGQKAKKGLIQTDYQLYQALNILKGLAVQRS